MRAVYEVGRAKVLLDIPETLSRKVVLFLPGISGGAHSDRFQPLVDASLRKNFAVARIALWEGENDVVKTSPKEIFNELTEVIQFLKEKGYEHFAGVGKSFGGGMMLGYINNTIETKVLWAPYITYVKEHSNLLSISFAELDHLSEMSVDLEHLAQFNGPTLFIHGTKDSVIPHENSEILKNASKQAVVELIDGADHSFKNPEHEKELIERTISFISMVL